MSFSTETEHNETTKEEKKVAKKSEDVIKSAIAMLEVPTKSGQLERDIRSMKNDLNSQRDYLVRIDPDNLKTIFNSSIEFETVLGIAKALNFGTKKWVKTHSEYLVNFITKLTEVERFDMAVAF